MTLLIAKAYVKCPKTGKKVKLSDPEEGCAGCDFCGPVGMKGKFNLSLTCRYSEYNKYAADIKK